MRQNSMKRKKRRRIEPSLFHFFIYVPYHFPVFQNYTPHFTFTRDTTDVFALRSEPRVFPYGRSPTRGATAMGINIESIRFAVFTLVHPSIFVPIRMITREPVTDI